MTVNPEIQYNEKKGSVFISENDEVLAKMTFVFAGEKKIIIDHTEVNADFNGKGFGKLMVEKAVAFAREKEISIVPLCPFAKSVFDKNPELRNVL